MGKDNPPTPKHFVYNRRKRKRNPQANTCILTIVILKGKQYDNNK